MAMVEIIALIVTRACQLFFRVDALRSPALRIVVVNEVSTEVSKAPYETTKGVDEEELGNSHEQVISFGPELTSEQVRDESREEQVGWLDLAGQRKMCVSFSPRQETE
jgi:hypothetical protein